MCRAFRSGTAYETLPIDVIVVLHTVKMARDTYQKDAQSSEGRALTALFGFSFSPCTVKGVALDGATRGVSSLSTRWLEVIPMALSGLETADVLAGWTAPESLNTDTVFASCAAWTRKLSAAAALSYTSAAFCCVT
jgi:hypothetical protein